VDYERRHLEASSAFAHVVLHKRLQHCNNVLRRCGRALEVCEQPPCITRRIWDEHAGEELPERRLIAAPSQSHQIQHCLKELALLCILRIELEGWGRTVED